ncbi:MAG: hypothetical protein COB67_09570 [SAR324 cluster bacterium]|uniref:histidine kinase n=1 Tax=SAR324 cluster bacterium TaxID=2024889 RepID=A0A2A4T138_9DELT|nr:MAG: hypothetical protein COB67_09570 [SAR324 cluster bacterium]
MEKPKVLIVEDNSIARRIIRNELSTGDFEIFEAVDGRDALELIPQIAPDILTLDVEMPFMDGFSLCKKLRNGETEALQGREDLQHIPVIFISSNTGWESRKRGFDVGATEFIAKPPVAGRILKAVEEALANRARFQGLTALVVDESRVARRAIASILRQEGILIIEAADGQEGLHIMEKEDVKIDLVLTSYRMPRMGGGPFCQAIRQQRKNKEIPVIFITDSKDKGTILEIFQSGATDYLVKPLLKEELFARLNIHLQERVLRRELRSNVAELRKANKMKDEFLAIASHDLRTPLNGILGFSDVLERDEDLTEDGKEYLGYIRTSGEHLLNLIQDLLDVSRYQSDSSDVVLKPLDPSIVLQSSIATLRHLASSKQIQLGLIDDFKGDAPFILGEKNGFTQIINNLLSNAIKFTPKLGQVTVRLFEEEDYLMISVEDTGVGIPQELLPTLFDRFTKASRPGTEGERSIGLGLSITKALVERFQGKISVYNRPSEGTRFQLQFLTAHNNSTSPTVLN